MFNFNSLRPMAFFAAVGSTIIAIVFAFAIFDEAYLHRDSMSDSALANIRGTNPQACKVKSRDCTNEAILAYYNDYDIVAVRADSCTDNSGTVQCIACRSGVYLYNGQQMMYPAPSPPQDPTSAYYQNCGLQASGNVGSSGTCQESPDGNSILCMNTSPFNCTPVTNYNAQ